MKDNCLLIFLCLVVVAKRKKFFLKKHKIHNYGIKDSLHVASALEGKTDYFLTTDDKLLSCTNRSNTIKALNPIGYIKVLEK